MPFDPFGQKIQPENVVLGKQSSVKKFDTIAASQEFTNEFTAQLKQEIKNKNITSAEEVIKLAHDLYPKVFQEMVKNQEEPESPKLSEAIGHYVHKNELFNTLNNCYTLQDGLQGSPLLNQSTKESKERVRYLSMFNNPLRLDTEDYIRLNESMKVFHGLQQEAAAINRTIDPNNPEMMADADILNKRIDPVIEKFNSPFSPDSVIPKEYQGQRLIYSVERNSLANTYA